MKKKNIVDMDSLISTPNATAKYRAQSLISLYLSLMPTWEFPPHLVPVAEGLCDERIEKLQLQVGPGAGKGLVHGSSVYTNINEYKKVEDIVIGDSLLHPDGISRSEVIGVWPQKPMLVYRISFSDGRYVIANGPHVWKVNVDTHDRSSYKLMTTSELIQHMKYQKRSIRIPLIKPIDVPDVDLPIDPYVMGAVLGDGHITNDGYMTIGCNDEYIINRVVKKLGYPLERVLKVPYDNKYVYILNTNKLRTGLYDLGLVGARSLTKFIPDMYLSSSIKQRRALLQGFMDTDGYVSKNGTLCYVTISPLLAQGVCDIVRSLGGKARINILGGLRNNTAYRINISINDSYKYLGLKRKRDRTLYKKNPTNSLRIVNITNVGIRPTVCLTVKNKYDDGLFITDDYVVTHNSQLISCVYPTFLLGEDPRKNVIGISGAEDLIKKFQKTSMEFIEFSKGFREFFPSVFPDKKTGWSTDSGAYLTGRNTSVPDPNWWVGGIASQALVGKHASDIILDDIHTAENTATDLQCNKVHELYLNTIIGRAQSTGARFVLAGRRWRINDLYGRLESSGDWVTMRLPARRAGSEELYFDVMVPEGLECIFTEDYGPPVSVNSSTGVRTYKVMYGIDPLKDGFFWPQMSAKRKEFMSVFKMSPSIAEAVYQCRPGKREGSIFLESMFRYADIPQDIVPAVEWANSMGATIIQAWDTATGSTEKSDYSVCITAALVPCDTWHHGEDPSIFGACDAHMDVYILNVSRSNVKFGELLGEVKRMKGLWKPSSIVMEKKSSGIQILQTLQTIGFPIEAINPGIEGKRARAVNGVGTGTGSVEGWFTLGRVIFPYEAPWLATYKDELTDFSGDGSGFDDQVDATVYLISQAIKLGAGGVKMPTGIEDEKGYGGETEDQNGLMTAIGMLTPMNVQGFDPFNNTCGRCTHLKPNLHCTIQKRFKAKLDTCASYEPDQSDGYINIWNVNG